ncbi:MAG: hypothetical protein D6683_01535 [Actinomyces sp.]|nr:MAG: hypothetical protein D6683_01535 [Actinomyces sp.]
MAVLPNSPQLPEELRFFVRVNDIDFPVHRFGYVKHYTPFVIGLNVRPSLDVDGFVYDSEEDRWYTCSPLDAIEAMRSDTMVKGDLVPVPDYDLRLRFVRNYTSLYRITAPHWMNARALSAFGWTVLEEVPATNYNVSSSLFVPSRTVFRLQEATFSDIAFKVKTDTPWLDCDNQGFYAAAPYLELLRPDLNAGYRYLQYPPTMRARLTVSDLVERTFLRNLLPSTHESLALNDFDNGAIETFHLPGRKVVFDGRTVAVQDGEYVWVAAGRNLVEALDALNHRNHWPSYLQYEWLETVKRDEQRVEVNVRRLRLYGDVTMPIFEEIAKAVPMRRTIFSSDKPHSFLTYDVDANAFGIEIKN